MIVSKEEWSVIRIFAGSPQFAWMVEALSAAGLPTSDLDDGFAEYFATDDFSAFGGFCRFETSALLRSIVVIDGRRKQGTGSQLLGVLISYARAAAVRDLWLLTTTAKSFFARHGFDAAERTNAPPAIANTSLFRDLCPASATLMHRRIA